MNNLGSMDPTILASVIGVLGIILGSLMTILSETILRHFDLKREDQREAILVERRRKEKEYQIKQELYKVFLGELASLETFAYADQSEFQRDWIKTEVKLDLVASPEVRAVKEKIQKEIFALAEKNIGSKNLTLSPAYFGLRDELLQAIKKDIAIFQKQNA